MGRLTRRYLKQVAIYWAPLPNDRFGNATFDNPIEVKCRWADVQEEFVDKDAQRQLSRSSVVVGEKLVTEGWLWLSSKRVGDPVGSALAEVQEKINALEEGAKIPNDIDGAYPIRAFSSIPNRKATDFYFEAKL